MTDETPEDPVSTDEATPAEQADAADDSSPAEQSVATDEPVLTDDEKEALLDGMSNGEIEVHSSKGPTYASVTDFQVAARSHIQTNSYPRLQSLNKEFASRVGKQVEALLNAESEITFERIRTCTFSEFCEQTTGLSLLLEFAPKPLDGSALINLDSSLVETLVETFYGGDSNESTRGEVEFFTPGEINVATLFSRAVVNVTGEVWQSMASLTPEILGSHLNSGVIDCVESGDAVIASEYELKVRGNTQKLHIVWPVATIASLLPLFEGQKRERNTVQDLHWSKSIRTRVVDSIINISSSVGHAAMTLGEVAELSPGDVIMIGNPQKTTVFARDVAILEGRFGVLDGRHAVETTQWLDPEVGSDTATH